MLRQRPARGRRAARPTTRPRAPRSATRIREWLSTAVVGLARRRRDPRAAGRRQRARRARAARQRAGRARRRRLEGRREGDALVVDGPFDALAHPLYAAGRVHAAVARLPARRPRRRPAARRAHARPLRRARRQDHAPRRADGRRGEIVAVERHPRRAQALVAQAQRLHADAACASRSPTPRRSRPSARRPLRPRPGGPAVQRPRARCASHPDLRWRMTPGGDRASCASSRRRSLAAARGALAPGGRLVYSTCTLSPREETSAWRDRSATFPHRDRTDGFYIAVADGG